MSSKTLNLVLRRLDGGTCGAILQFLQPNLVRFRFNPGKQLTDFSAQSSRAIVMDTSEELRATLERSNPFTIGATSARPRLGTTPGSNPTLNGRFSATW
jgi:hypothetical protein